MKQHEQTEIQRTDFKCTRQGAKPLFYTLCSAHMETLDTATLNKCLNQITE